MTELASGPDLATWRSGDPATLVAAAEGAVRLYCGWHIAPLREDDAVTVDGSGAKVQGLPTMHLVDVSAVTEDGETVDLEPVQWSEAGYLWRCQAWTRKLRGVIATITHGYEDVPPEVHAVVLDLAQLMVNSQGGAVRQVAGPFQVQVAAQQMTDLHKLVLDRYRIPSAT